MPLQVKADVADHNDASFIARDFHGGLQYAMTLRGRGEQNDINASTGRSRGQCLPPARFDCEQRPLGAHPFCQLDPARIDVQGNHPASGGG